MYDYSNDFQQKMSQISAIQQIFVSKICYKTGSGYN